MKSWNSSEESHKHASSSQVSHRPAPGAFVTSPLPVSSGRAGSAIYLALCGRKDTDSVKEPPTALDEARVLANVQARADRLFEDGYRARWIDSSLVEVDSPQGETYQIDTDTRTCDCPFFEKGKAQRRRGPDRTCKHLLGLSKLLEKQDGEDWKKERRLHNQKSWEALA
jgi:hypothetical protein